MKKITIFIGLILIAVVLIPVIYAVFPQYQPAIGDFFGGLQQSALVLFTGFSEQFTQLPYWVAIFGAICLLFGVMIDRWAWGFVLGLRKNLVGTAIRDTGLYQRDPPYQQSTPSQPAERAILEPPPKEIEAT